MEKLDIAIVGAGVVGLAVAAEIARRQDELATIVLERHGKFGQDTSSRNSEVIHAGMYYPTGSLKAKLCVAGNRLLYEFCEQHEVPFQRIGKLIVASEAAEIEAIDAVYAQGVANGVPGLTRLDAAEAKKLEPNIKVETALFSESTGIIDTHKLMARLEHLATANYAMLAYKHEVTGIKPVADGYEVTFLGPDGQTDAIECRWLINCAGLYADKIAAMCGIDTAAAGYEINPVKGEYFAVGMGKSKLVNHLIYPPPLHGLKGLGTHVTKSLDGRARLGPNVVNVTDREDYDVDPEHLEEFYQAAAAYLPFIGREDLAPDMAGVRPKLKSSNGAVVDFIIRHETERGLPGLVNLVGIESPGLTACLAIANHVADIVDAGL
ncbi:NAD(P)/FAD-dependent oxidoreductase [Anaeroselena agilis]|uniref:NAD(P)/FAD-dependent oxidoreductase n=1 Tax=Anaeroselena agilis TaxID=3063788 RepID=A0ABU3P2B1_9FIRM|nr:NAD(P)/FAD-dependent oxidoreductase [Selenomonadales bacterium 4137-cl]